MRVTVTVAVFSNKSLKCDTGVIRFVCGVVFHCFYKSKKDKLT